MKKRSYSGLVEDLRCANVEAKTYLNSANHLREENEKLRKENSALAANQEIGLSINNVQFRIIKQLLEKLEAK